MTETLSSHKQYVLNKIWDKDNTSLLIVGTANPWLDETQSLTTIEQYISKGLLKVGIDSLGWSRDHLRILSDRLAASDILVFGRRTLKPKGNRPFYLTPYTLCFLGKKVDLDKNIELLDLTEAINKSRDY